MLHNRKLIVMHEPIDIYSQTQIQNILEDNINIYYAKVMQGLEYEGFSDYLYSEGIPTKIIEYYKEFLMGRSDLAWLEEHSSKTLLREMLNQGEE